MCFANLRRAHFVHVIVSWKEHQMADTFGGSESHASTIAVGRCAAIGSWPRFPSTAYPPLATVCMCSTSSEWRDKDNDIADAKPHKRLRQPNTAASRSEQYATSTRCYKPSTATGLCMCLCCLLSLRRAACCPPPTPASGGIGRERIQQPR